MTGLEIEVGDELRYTFRRFNRFMLLMWRLGLGSWFNVWPKVSGRILVITHRGRKSGKLYQTPVNYAVVDGEVYCTAGFGSISDWYRNILADSNIQVWLPEGWWEGQAEDVSDSEDRLYLMRQVLIGSGFAARAFGIDPIRIDDETLDKLSADYRLVHLGRNKERTGVGGPGDLAWVWPVMTFLLLPLALFRRRRR
jgi:deazaflavin-dependent oxidoreductase (nitroreductase family)